VRAGGEHHHRSNRSELVFFRTRSRSAIVHEGYDEVAIVVVQSSIVMRKTARSLGRDIIEVLTK
jgi:hypothetical protein